MIMTWEPGIMQLDWFFSQLKACCAELAIRRKPLYWLLLGSSALGLRRSPRNARAASSHSLFGL